MSDIISGVHKKGRQEVEVREEKSYLTTKADIRVI